jgi:hypothetical protein
MLDEIACRKRWTHVIKNTSKALKEQHMNNHYWNLINHAPQNMVKNVVTDAVLKMDMNSCEKLLKSIINE